MKMLSNKDRLIANDIWKLKDGEIYPSHDEYAEAIMDYENDACYIYLTSLDLGIENEYFNLRFVEGTLDSDALLCAIAINLHIGC